MKKKLTVLMLSSLVLALSACSLLPRIRTKSSEEPSSSELSEEEPTSITSEITSEESYEDPSEEPSKEPSEEPSEESSEELSEDSSEEEESSLDESSEEESSIEESSEEISSEISSENPSSENSSEGPTPVVFNEEDSNAQAKSISAMLEANGNTNNTTTLYRITGVAQWPKNTTYGNFDIVDTTGYVYVYGCSKNKSSMSKSGNNYSYSNDKTFSSMNIKPGDTVTMEGLYVWYAYSAKYGVPEFKGYVTSVVHNNLSDIQGMDYTAEETYTGTYYDSLDTTKSAAAFKTDLHNLMDTTHDNYVSYSSLDNHFKKSDKSGTGVKCFYSGQSTSSFNKEHVWPQSLSGSSTTQLYGETYGGSDIHHIRPTISSYNSIRGNAMFGPVYGTKGVMQKIDYASGGADYCSGNVFEPADSIKGDVARIIMYMYIHYSNEIGGNSQSYYGEMHINWVMGTSPTDSWKLLRYWNALDPVSAEERTRNDYAFSIQGNRNPFIDHPSYADIIWG